jgi:hypothetical protein
MALSIAEDLGTTRTWGGGIRGKVKGIRGSGFAFGFGTAK